MSFTMRFTSYAFLFVGVSHVAAVQVETQPAQEAQKVRQPKFNSNLMSILVSSIQTHINDLLMIYFKKIFWLGLGLVTTGLARV